MTSKIIAAIDRDMPNQKVPLCLASSDIVIRQYPEIDTAMAWDAVRVMIEQLFVFPIFC